MREVVIDAAARPAEARRIDAFLNPSLRPRSAWLFVVRRAILRALKQELAEFSGTVLDIGCGHMAYRSLLTRPPGRADQYFGLDLGSRDFPDPDLLWDGRSIPLPEASVDGALMMEVLEHCAEPDVVLREAHRVLRPGSPLFVTVPFLWPIHGVPHDEYRYTPAALRRHLERSGFELVRMEALGGWHASLAQMLALWSRFGVRAKLPRMAATWMSLPLIYALSLWDRRPRDLEQLDNVMITGLSGLARKRAGARA